MDFERELTFAKKLLDNFSIPLTLVGRDIPQPAAPPWAELRRLLRQEADISHACDTLRRLCVPRVIYRCRDALGCNALVFQVRGGEDPVFAIAGPYLLQPLTRDPLPGNAGSSEPEDIPTSLERYRREVPCLPNENRLLVLLFTLEELLWEGGSITVQELPVRPGSPALNAREVEWNAPDGESVRMEVLENRYAEEERLMKAVSSGQADQAAIAYSRLSARQTERRAAPPLRDMKNRFVAFNTLLRKAAQYGHVHPLYIDRLSGGFARQIEAAPSSEALAVLGPKMVHRYCQLVRDFSMKGRSHLISQLLMHIEADLTADLSLSAQAKLLNVNSSYLSTLFKKELGTTLTEYVGRRRVDYAMFLLGSTSLQIQTIAQNCGIPDVNYFTRTFKKYVGTTPKEYRSRRIGG